MNKYSCTHPFIYIAELYREDNTRAKLSTNVLLTIFKFIKI